jgi:putative membrane protein
MRFLLHWATLALGLFVVTKITPITYSSPWDLVWAALVLIFFNTIIKPVLILITLPAVLLSLGLFVLLINALLLYWVPVFVHGFQVPGFGWAFVGSIILSLITWAFTGVEKRTVQRRVVTRADSGKVIDI